jgi:NitT/TauT family transport system permease protein
MKLKLQDLVFPTLFTLFVFALWESLVRGLEIKSSILPGPLEVFQSGVANFSKLANAFRLTGLEALLGLLASTVLGISIGAIFSQSRWVRLSCYPYAIFLQTVPIVAIAPLIVTWFGYGFQSVVLISGIISLFPIITSTTTGLMHVEQDLVDLFRLYKASRWQILSKLRFPAAVGSILTGLRTSSGLAVVGAIVGEYFTGYDPKNFGLGYYIFTTYSQLKTPLLFATVFTSTLLGLAFFLGINLLSSTVLRHWTYNIGREEIA